MSIDVETIVYNAIILGHLLCFALISPVAIDTIHPSSYHILYHQITNSSQFSAGGMYVTFH